MTNSLVGGEISLNAIFAFSSQLAMLGWVILLFLPRGLLLLMMVPRYVIPLFLCLLYSSLVFIDFFNNPGGFGSLEAVKLLFQSERALLAGWLHFLAFDLFIGAWIAKEADLIGLSRVLQIPILLVTFLLGPIGLAVFLGVRATMRTKETNYA